MGKLIRTAATATIALWTATASAGNGNQSPAENPQAQVPPPQPTGSAPPATQPQGTPALVLDTKEYEGLLGKSVRAMNGDDLGRIIDVIVDKDGRPRAAIIDFGGFLGVGSRKIAVDWRVLKFAVDGKSGPVTLQLSRNQVRVSPEYKTGEPIVVLGSSSPGGPAEGEQAAAPAALPAVQEKPQEKLQDRPVEKQPEKIPE